MNLCEPWIRILIQGKLVPKLTRSVRNGPNLLSYLFPYIYKKWLKIFIETRNVNFNMLKIFNMFFLYAPQNTVPKKPFNSCIYWICKICIIKFGKV